MALRVCRKYNSVILSSLILWVLARQHIYGIAPSLSPVQGEVEIIP